MHMRVVAPEARGKSSARPRRALFGRQQRQHRLDAAPQRRQHYVIKIARADQRTGAEQIGRRAASSNDPVHAATAHFDEFGRHAGNGKMGRRHALFLSAAIGGSIGRLAGWILQRRELI